MKLRRPNPTAGRALAILILIAIDSEAFPISAPTMEKAAVASRNSEPVALQAWWAPIVLPLSLFAPGSGQFVRGDAEAGWRMLGASAGLFGTAIAGAFLMGATGAADVSTYVGVPLALVGIGGFAALEVTDFVGAFSQETDPFSPALRADSWNASLRVGVDVGFLSGSNGLTDGPVMGAFGSWRSDRWLVQGELGGTVGSSDFWVGAGSGYRLWRYSEAVPRSGVWIEAGARHERARTLGFDATRLRVQAVSTLPMGVFGPRFGRVTSQIRFGIDPTFVRYAPRGTLNLETPLSGGFEVRVAAAEWLRLFGGYDHARDGIVGGLGTGFFGSFYAGAETSLTRSLVLQARAAGGTPSLFSASLEWRQ